MKQSWKFSEEYRTMLENFLKHDVGTEFKVVLFEMTKQDKEKNMFVLDELKKRGKVERVKSLYDAVGNPLRITYKRVERKVS